MPRRSPEFLVFAIDVGTSSLRTALFDDRARHLSGTTARERYAVRYFSDGGAELSPAILNRAAAKCLRQTLRVYRASQTLKKIPIAAVGGSGFWHSLLGLDRIGKAITPIYTWADARSDDDAKQLRARLSERAVQMRTGCMLRPSFWPAKLQWLRRTQPRLFHRVARWVSPADWIFQTLFGVQTSSASMASATGLYDYYRETWDEKLCEICEVDQEQLPSISQSTDFIRSGSAQLRSAKVFCPIGDGAAGNLGSSADREGSVAINLGTSAAARMLLTNRKARRVKLPFGLFRYVVDSNHSLIGGAISNAGNLRSWCLRELRLDNDPRGLRQALHRAAAAEESISILPFWANERAPSWPDKQHGTIAGLTQATSAAEIFRATTLSFCNRLAQIVDAVEEVVAGANRVIISGGLVRSMSTVRLLADTLGRDVEICREAEASLRGAAVHALRSLGRVPDSLGKGKVVRHDPRLASKHRARRSRQIALEKLLARFD